MLSQLFAFNIATTVEDMSEPVEHYYDASQQVTVWIGDDTAIAGQCPSWCTSLTITCTTTTNYLCTRPGEACETQYLGANYPGARCDFNHPCDCSGCTC